MRKTWSCLHLGLAGLLLALGVGALGCAEEERCPCAEKQKLDQELMLVLGSARALHHQADLYLQQGQPERALEAIQAVIKLTRGGRWPEAEEVLLDATARLAKLLLGRGEEQQALSLVEAETTSRPGAHRESFYLSNLHSVRGDILEHRAKRLDQAKDAEGARRAAKDAIAAFEESIAMNKRLQQRLRGEAR